MTKKKKENTQRLQKLIYLHLLFAQCVFSLKNENRDEGMRKRKGMQED